MPRLRPLAPDLPTVGQFLAGHLPWSPHDYVTGISRKGDRAWYAEQLTEPLPAGDDLRYSFEGATEEEAIWIFARRLEWDSEFFGFGVARLDAVFPAGRNLRLEADYSAALAAFIDVARQRSIHYLFALIDPRDLPTLRALGELGFSLLETRYFHHGPVAVPSALEPLPLRLARESDIPSLARAASTTINPYDRFHADPYLPSPAVERLMQRWVAESVRGRMADLVLVPDVESPGALVTFRLHQDRWDRWGIRLAQGVFSAVAPDFMGWMGKLGPHLNAHLAARGVTQSFGSTQVTNRPVIWFAQEAGARFGRCEHVLRRLI